MLFVHFFGSLTIQFPLSFCLLSMTNVQSILPHNGLCALLFTYLRISQSNYKIFWHTIQVDLKRCMPLVIIVHHSYSLMNWSHANIHAHTKPTFFWKPAWYPFPLARAPIHPTVSFHYRRPTPH